MSKTDKSKAGGPSDEHKCQVEASIMQAVGTACHTGTLAHYTTKEVMTASQCCQVLEGVKLS